MTGKEDRDKRMRKGEERPRHSQRGRGGRRGREEQTSDVEEGEDGAEGVPRIARAHAACPSTPASGPGARPCTCSSSSPALVLYHPPPSLAHFPERHRLGDCHCSTQPWLRTRPSTPPRASRPSASSWLSQNTAYRRSWFRLKTNASIHSHCGHPRDAYDLA